MKFSRLALLILILATIGHAQNPSQLEPVEEREQAVQNEDGGRAWLVLPPRVAAPASIKARAMGISEVQQNSIFLGNGWTDQSLRQHEQTLSHLLLNLPAHPELQDLLDSGINVYAPAFSLEKPDVAGNRALSDLEIQSILRDSLKQGLSVNRASLFVVFLDAGLRSTLGPLTAEKHYLAYHGYFNNAGARVHYVVVPFEAEPKAAYRNALRAFIVAALHTD